MVRPELMSILAPGEEADAAIDVAVTEIFDKGSTLQYRTRSDAGSEVIFELPGRSQKPAALGDRIRLGWPKRDIFVFADRDGAA